MAAACVKNTPNPQGFVRFFPYHPSIFRPLSPHCRFGDTLWQDNFTFEFVKNILYLAISFIPGEVGKIPESYFH